MKLAFTPSMEIIFRKNITVLSALPVLVFLNWNAVVVDSSRPFRVYCDVSIDGFGAKVEWEQLDSLVRPTAYIGRATLDSDRR